MPTRRNFVLAAATVLGASLYIIAPTAAGGQAVGHRVNVNGMRMYYEASGQRHGPKQAAMVDR